MNIGEQVCKCKLKTGKNNKDWKNLLQRETFPRNCYLYLVSFPKRIPRLCFKSLSYLVLCGLDMWIFLCEYRTTSKMQHQICQPDVPAPVSLVNHCLTFLIWPFMFVLLLWCSYLYVWHSSTTELMPTPDLSEASWCPWQTKLYGAHHECPTWRWKRDVRYHTRKYLEPKCQ